VVCRLTRCLLPGRAGFTQVQCLRKAGTRGPEGQAPEAASAQAYQGCSSVGCRYRRKCRSAMRGLHDIPFANRPQEAPGSSPSSPSEPHTIGRTSLAPGSGSVRAVSVLSGVGVSGRLRSRKAGVRGSRSCRTAVPCNNEDGSPPRNRGSTESPVGQPSPAVNPATAGYAVCRRLRGL
jgi:hypothetical protein